MKHLISILFLVAFLISCHSPAKIKLNDKEEIFTTFPTTDSLKFTKLSKHIIETPKTILKYHDYLIINTMNQNKSKWIIIYSLREDRVVKEIVNYGKGPDEMLSCNIGRTGNKIWLYDLTKKEIGEILIDSLIFGRQLNIQKFRTDRIYYSIALLNDSTMLGTTDWTTPFKISYVNLRNGNTIGRGEYAMLTESIPLEALVDACSCYINIHPDTKEIALSYRYTDMLEIYKVDGTLVHALHGPRIFDIEFDPASRDGHNFMAKNRKTTKAFVNSYVTDKYIYLLFSGHKRSEEGWSTGQSIFIYSWNGKPLKSLCTDFPIYSFCVDEEDQTIYSYSMITGELIKAKYEE